MSVPAIVGWTSAQASGTLHLVERRDCARLHKSRVNAVSIRQQYITFQQAHRLGDAADTAVVALNGAGLAGSNLSQRFSIAFASTSARSAATVPIGISPPRRWCSSVEPFSASGLGTGEARGGDAP